MLLTILSFLGSVGGVVGLIVGIITIKSYVAERIKKNKLFRNRFFYPVDTVNEMARKFDFSHCAQSKYLKDTVLDDYYPDAFTPMDVNMDGEKRTIRLPYKEVIDFVAHPNATITIDALRVDKPFQLRPEIEEATEDVLAEFNKERKCTDEAHPRLSSLSCIGEDQYICTIEKATYFQQIRTNLTLDYPIAIKGLKGDSTMRAYDYAPYKRLPELDESCLSNAIGVSAIWMMGKPGHRRVFLLPRKKRVGVFETKLGIPSGNVEMPNNDCFDSSSLIDFLTMDIAREFVEETGLCGKNIDIKQFSLPVKEPTWIEHMQIIPLAFVRELLRGGKPQMFFLILTPEVPIRKLKKSFRASLGTEEFEDSILTSSAPSSETMCNYIYAQKYLNNNLPLLPL